MLYDIARSTQRCQNVHESEQLHFKMLVPHGEGHHPLVKAGFGKNRLRILVNELKNSFTSLLDLVLQRTHVPILTRWAKLGKAERLPGSRLKRKRSYMVTWGVVDPVCSLS